MLRLRKFLRNLKKIIVIHRRSTERIRLLEERIRSLEWSLLAERTVQVEEVEALLRPVPNGHTMQRFGSDNDGGYALPTDFGLPDTVISIGVGNECSVDDQLACSGARVVQFDHTVARSPASSDGIVFHKIGLSGSIPGAQTRPLASLLDLAGVNPEARMWLMLDAEGVEWDLLADASAPLKQFTVINIEFHRLSSIMHTDERSTSIIWGLENLRRKFVPIAWSANNFAPVSVIGRRWVTDVLEVTFVSQACFKAGETVGFEEHIRPNNPNGPQLPRPFSEAAENPYGWNPAGLRE